uniref:3',5'-cyclic-GMP phosphodiesterase n=1 Tax=Poecilia formosa TaxID=48698 RepID=A0A087XGE9_POEFO
CSPENERMEAWLDDHLEFTHSYFVKKASREMVNAWFAERAHTIQPSVPKNSTILSSSLTLLDNRCPSPATVPSPAPGTPTRKISASEFDRPLRPIVVKDSEGSLTFLSDSEREPVPLCGSVMGEGGGDDGSGREVDRCTRLLELVKEVSSYLDVTALCHKIFLHINELITADRYSLFLVGEDSSNRKFLVSRLFDVAEGSTLEESSTSCIRLEWNKGIVGHVASTGQLLNIKNAYEDPRFNAEVDLITGYKTQSILCLPIKNHREEVVGVVQAINKKCGENSAFTEQDEKDFSAYLAFSGIVLHNAQLYETSQLENRRNQVLLDLARLIFEEQQCLEVVLRKIAGTILSFMQAQACTVFIADDDSMNVFSQTLFIQ